MDAGQIILGVGASIGGAGLVMGGGGWVGSGVESDGGLRPALLRRWCWPFCPPLFGAIVAVIVLLAYGEALRAEGWALATGVIGTIAGATGATASLCIQSMLRR
jgi:hypothetical protein